MRIRFITSTPLDVSRGSGTFVGISTLANSLRHQGVEIGFVVPSFQLPIYTLQRLVFNQSLRFRQLLPTDITIGFDMDGYTLSRRATGLHIASIKGVIADEMRFESGLTHATMRIQAACERIHVHTARTVFTTSQYSAGRIQSRHRAGGCQVRSMSPVPDGTAVNWPGAEGHRLPAGARRPSPRPRSPAHSALQQSPGSWSRR